MAEVKTQKIILKKSSVAGKIPTADQLDPGELAINLDDGLLTSKDTSDNIIDLNSFDRKLSGYSNDGTIKGEITSDDSIKTALSKIENNIIDDEKVTSEALNDLNSSKVDKSSVSSSNPTLSFGGTSTIGSVDGKDFKVTMPANPNTDTKVTSAANHYSPTSVTYTPTVGSAVTWGGAVVTGITKDDKGHIVGVTTGAIPENPGSSYTLPVASSTTLGGIKVGYTSSGKHYQIQLNEDNHAYVYVPWTDTDTHYTSKNIIGASATASANAAASNGSVFINHLESNSVTPTSSHKIIGSGATTVVSDASGNITINSTNTTYNVATTTANGLMSSADKTKLDGVDTGANNYVHPTTSGNKHIPSGGSSGQILRWSADGTAVWGADTDTNTTYTFTGGTNSFQVTPSGGSAQVVAVTPSVSSLSTARTISLTGAVTGSVSTNFSANASIATTLAGFDASKITSGTISIDRLPKGALERLSIVANTAARLALTTATVQNGDTVKQTDTGVMYYVKDDTKLSTEAGWEPYSAGTATSVPWSGVTGKPSTFTPADHTHPKSQITDFPTTWSWNNISDKPSSYTPSSHTQSYTTLTGSTTTANQAIVSNGTANGWTLKTLGNNAFNSTAIPTTYAGSSSAGGAATSANKVNTNLVLKVNSGTTEGTNLYTFNGSAAKTLDIKAGSNVSLSATAGVLTISSTNTTYGVATSSANGLMSSTDKSKLDGITAGATANTGTVTSVAMTVPTGLSISGTPITSSGTLALSFASGYSIPTTAKQTNWDTAYGWGNHASAGYTKNTGTVTSVATGVGLVGGTITSSGTLKAKLRSETALTVDSAAATTTSGRVYPVAVDKTGYLSVNVPWTDSNTTYSAGTGMSLSGTTFNCTVVNTDTKVTAVGNHYVPSGGTTLSASGGGSLTANSSQVITGITRDAAGHITGVTSGKLPADSNTTYTFANGTNGFTVTPSGSSAQTVSITVNTVKSPDGTKVLNVANDGSTLSGILTVSDRVNSVNGFFQTSDKRLKENVIDLESSLDKISKIPTVNFNYISDEDKKVQIGTIADEVEKVFPELVSKGSDGYKTVDYSKFSIIALAAIKELNEKIDELMNRIKV